MSTIAIIPSRGGSTRIPRKNIKLFHGKPIIAYSIETAQQVGIFDRIIVSTDDDEIASIAKRYGAEVMMRSAELSRNEVGTQEVIRAVTHQVYDIKKETKYVCCIYPCAPMLLPQTLQRAYQMLVDSPLTPHVVPVGTWLCDPGQFYFSREIYLNVPYNADGTQIIKIVANRDCDINTMEDWERAEKMYAELKGIK